MGSNKGELNMQKLNITGTNCIYPYSRIDFFFLEFTIPRLNNCSKQWIFWNDLALELSNWLHSIYHEGVALSQTMVVQALPWPELRWTVQVRAANVFFSHPAQGKKVIGSLESQRYKIPLLLKYGLYLNLSIRGFYLRCYQKLTRKI